MKFASTRPWIGLAVAGAIAIGLAAFVYSRSVHERQVLDASIPMQPDMRALPQEYQQRVQQCEQRARGGDAPIDALGELARLYHANGFLAEATQAYRGLLQVDSDSPQWPYLLANILAGYGQSDEAVPLIKRTIELAPDYLPGRLRLGDVLLKVGETAGASEAYVGALRLEPTNTYALLGLARCEVAAERWAEARAHLRKAIAANNPDIESVWNLLATVADRLGDQREAEMARVASMGTRRFRELPDPWVDALMRDCYDAYRLGVASAVASSAGDMATARSLLERAVALAPNDASPHRLLGGLLYQKSEFTKARPLLERATELAPEEADNWVYLIALLNTVGDGPAAERALAAGLARCPNSPSLHSERGRRLKAAGRFEEALTEFFESRRLRPEEPGAYIEAALILFRLKRDKEADAELLGALKAEPENPFALTTLARRAIDASDQPAAAEWMRRVKAQSRVVPDELNELVRIYQMRFGRPPW
jgi:tetratricopeptide (TPR) repeat protein